MSLIGNAYWLASDIINKSEFLHSFDFTRERFKRLCLPIFQIRGWVSISVVREEQLSLLQRNFNTSKIEVWVTNKIDTRAALWTKSFTVDFHTGSNGFIKVPYSFLMDEEKNVVVSCNVSGKYSTEAVYMINKYCIESSLVVSTEVSWCPYIYTIFQVWFKSSP